MWEEGEYEEDRHEDTRPLRTYNSSSNKWEKDRDSVPLRTQGGTTFERYEQESYESIRRRERMPYKCIRVTLMVLIILTILIGVAFIALGIIPLVTYYTSYKTLSFMFNFIYVIVSAYGFLVVGLVFCVMCIIGILGVVKLSKCLLHAFALGIAIACVITIASGVLFVVFKHDVITRSIRNESYKEAIRIRYGVDVENNSTNKLVTEVVDFVQETFECCGSSGNVSSENSWGLFKVSEWYYTTINSKYPKVPDSCCVKGRDKELCQGKDRVRGPPNDGPGIQLDKKRYINENLHKNGCVDMISENSGKYIFIFGITLVSCTAIPIAAMGIAFCLGCFMDRDRTEY